MGNFHFNIISDSDQVLAQAMAIAFSPQRQGAVGYAIRAAQAANPEPAYAPQPAKPLRLVFFSTAPDPQTCPEFTPLPFKLDAAGATDFARRWLAEAEYPREPDHDGDNKKGWRVYNEGWSHVDGDFRAFAAVAPVWQVYGK